jgi:hypothetical protein
LVEVMTKKLSRRGAFRVRVECPVCGRSEVDPASVVLLAAAQPERCAFSFDCTICERPVTVSADERAVVSLASVGVPVLWLPDNYRPAETCDAPKLTFDDLLAFRHELAGLPTARAEGLTRPRGFRRRARAGC